MEKYIKYELYDGESGGAYRAGRYLAHAIKADPSKCLHASLNEEMPCEPNPDKKGGIIVFCTDMKGDEIAVDGDLVGWTIGHYLDGRYTNPRNGHQYDENSLSVEIIGVDLEQLVKISMELCTACAQESAPLKDYSSGRVLLVEIEEIGYSL